MQTPGAGAGRARSDRRALRALHAERVHPAGATLVLVGDSTPEQALDAAERALGGWTGAGARGRAAADPAAGARARCCWSTGPARCSRRCGWRCRRCRAPHPDHAALQLANLVFGGYFSSRWVENIREDKGYTYGPHSLIEHSVAGSALVVAAEVATEVTGPALLETLYELGRMAPPAAEARTSWSRPASTPWARCSSACPPRPGWPALASTYAGFGLRLDFLAEHAAAAGRRRPSTTSPQAAARYLAPARAVDRGARRRRAGRARWPR